MTRVVEVPLVVIQAPSFFVFVEELRAWHGREDAEERIENSAPLNEVERLLEHSERVRVEPDDEVADDRHAAGMNAIDGFLVGEAEVDRLIHRREGSLRHGFEPDNKRRASCVAKQI